ncbi:PIN domain-containing protein [Candidatus Woesearchaeota archaeon]|nr:PIN domain-containing protein [Candidatus Woesearchaeota archaeon]
MTATNQLDTSVWLAYFFSSSKEAKKIIEEENGLFQTSALSLFEIKKKLLALKKDPVTFLDFVKSRSTIITLTPEIAEKAAEIAISNKLGAMDALIYATSIFSKTRLITADNDFRGLERVSIIS